MFSSIEGQGVLYHFFIENFIKYVNALISRYQKNFCSKPTSTEEIRRDTNHRVTLSVLPLLKRIDTNATRNTEDFFALT